MLLAGVTAYGMILEKLGLCSGFFASEKDKKKDK